MLHSHLTSSQLLSCTQAVLTVKISTHYPPIFQLSQILQKKNQLSCYLYSEATTDEHTSAPGLKQFPPLGHSQPMAFVAIKIISAFYWFVCLRFVLPITIYTFQNTLEHEG